MSLLSISQDDLKGGQGAPLPAKPYRFVVYEAQVKELENGKQLVGRLGNLRTKEGATEFIQPDGSMYRIGNRLVFFRHWIEYTPDPKVSERGLRDIKKLLVTTGIANMPANGQPSEVEGTWAEIAEQLVAREGIVLTKQTKKYKVNGRFVKLVEAQQAKNEGQEVEESVDAEVATYLQA